mmetsp:Transcript_22043/g.47489  ORF Transcript_22043/g.47489 Transcript_22043/m.47489 type:complete len:260 (+) Transcript_22043:410-1189(+)
MRAARRRGARLVRCRGAVGIRTWRAGSLALGLALPSAARGGRCGPSRGRAHTPSPEVASRGAAATWRAIEDEGTEWREDSGRDGVELWHGVPRQLVRLYALDALLLLDRLQRDRLLRCLVSVVAYPVVVVLERVPRARAFELVCWEELGVRERRGAALGHRHQRVAREVEGLRLRISVELAEAPHLRGHLAVVRGTHGRVVGQVAGLVPGTHGRRVIWPLLSPAIVSVVPELGVREISCICRRSEARRGSRSRAHGRHA